MSTKKSMLAIWAVASILWVAFSYYTFDVHRVKHAYRTFERYEDKIAHGQKTAYYKRAYKRTRRQLDDANKDMGLFFLVGFGLPGLMLAFGTAALENVDKHKAKRK